MPAYLTDDIKLKLRRLAERYYPQEMCGVICTDVNGVAEYIDVPNTHPYPKGHFKIDVRVMDKLQQENKAIQAIVHSHPNGSSDASEYDKVQMNVHSRPYVIVGMDGDIAVHRPERAPLVGRAYVHGTQDCYGIVRDYYARELGIMVQNKERADRWWEDADSESLYVNYFKEFGFIEVPKSDMRRHDVLLCRWGNTQHINHALIYLGNEGSLISEETEPCVGSRLCLHHPYNGISGRFLLGDTRLAMCDLVVRHKDLV